MTKQQPSGSAKPTAKGNARGKARTTGFAASDVALVVGLGNPGPQYAGHRHNIGFMALDRAATDHGFGAWRAKFQGEIAEGRIGDKRVLLLKPTTFMNESGRAVGEAMRFLKIAPTDVIVIHDELDLAPGKCRFKLGGGHAGHNGLRSIHAHIGTEYARVRLGIGHPGDKNKVAGYVLHDFARADQDWLDNLLRGFSDGLPKLVQGDDAGFQNAVALRMNPPRSSDKAPRQAGQAARNARNAKAKTDEILQKASPDNPLARLLAKFSK